MDSPPTSSLSFLTRKGEPLDKPVEWKSCLVELPVPQRHREATVLLRNGEPLEISVRTVGGAARLVADWPFVSTGGFQLELDCPPAAISKRVTVDVRPSKLSDEAFDRLLFDLERRLPAAIAIGLSRLGGLSGIQILPPGLETFPQDILRIRLAIRGRGDRPGLRLVLDELAGDPHRNLIARDRWTTRERARRIDPGRLPQTIARGRIDDADRPAQVPETRVEHSTDNYENRLVRTFHDQLDQQLRELRKVAPRHSADAIAELDALAGELATARRGAAFLDAIGALEHTPDRVSMVLLKRAPYRAAFEGFLEFRRSAAVRLHEPALEAPLQHLHYLYQTWGTLLAIDVVLEQARAAGFKLLTNRIVVRHRSGLYVQLLRGGKPAVELRHPDGTEVRVLPQRSYRRGGSPLGSMSHTQIPDVAIEVERPGERPRVLVFDPKYKLVADSSGADIADGRPAKPDIDAMHAYRDAIRDDGGRRAVRYAAILYPGPTVEYGPGLAALRAQPLDVDPLRKALADAVDRCLGDESSPQEAAAPVE